MKDKNVAISLLGRYCFYDLGNQICGVSKSAHADYWEPRDHRWTSFTQAVALALPPMTPKPSKIFKTDQERDLAVQAIAASFPNL